MQRHIRDIRTTELLKRRIKIIALYMIIFGDEKNSSSIFSTFNLFLSI